MSDGVMTYAECVAAAEGDGCVVVIPKSNELFIDIDSESQFETFKRLIVTFQKLEHGARWTMAPSPSGKPGHYHVTVRLGRDIDNRERILLQAVLGSDPMRELLSLQRCDAGNPNPSLFFERPA